MKQKKRLILIIIFSVTATVVLYKYFEYQASMEYKDAGLPFYAQDKTTNKIIYAKKPKDFAQSMLAGEEYFKGFLNVRAIDHDTAELMLRNEITGDDTMAAIEYYAIVVRTPSGWKMTEFKMHWKCSRGLYWPKFWTTSGCI